jgi:hypothetical protein
VWGREGEAVGQCVLLSDGRVAIRPAALCDHLIIITFSDDPPSLSLVEVPPSPHRLPFTRPAMMIGWCGWRDQAKVED